MKLISLGPNTRLPPLLTLEDFQKVVMPSLSEAFQVALEKEGINGVPATAELKPLGEHGDEPYGKYWTLFFFEVEGCIVELGQRLGGAGTQTIGGFTIFASIQYKQDPTGTSIWLFKPATSVTIKR